MGIFNFIEERKKKIRENERIESELAMGNRIQLNMLPVIDENISERKDFELFASMQPAKEVGGDLYDFFFIDENHLALVIADVSGKGVPAALFMAITKTLIKDQAMFGISAGGIFTKVNRVLCEGNEEGLFVTAWIGILDLQTGGLDFCNAGHNPPIIKNQEEGFDYLHSKSGLVLAALDGYKYTSKHLTMHPGDVLFLYTDGITEAIDKYCNEYGSNTLLENVKKNDGLSMQDLCENITKDVEEFTMGIPQFDDQTMLAIKYNGGAIIDAMEVEAHIEELDKLRDFLDEMLDSVDCEPKTKAFLAIALDEIGSNICKYAYGVSKDVGYIRLKVEKIEEPNGIRLTFEDGGRPFNPLLKDDPDVSLSLKERSIGGLGIYMVKKTMDEVSYKHKRGKNILTVFKKL